MALPLSCPLPFSSPQGDERRPQTSQVLSLGPAAQAKRGGRGGRGRGCRGQGKGSLGVGIGSTTPLAPEVPARIGGDMHAVDSESPNLVWREDDVVWEEQRRRNNSKKEDKDQSTITTCLDP